MDWKCEKIWGKSFILYMALFCIALAGTLIDTCQLTNSYVIQGYCAKLDYQNSMNWFFISNILSTYVIWNYFTLNALLHQANGCVKECPWPRH